MYKLCSDILAMLELDGVKINKEYTFPPKQELTKRLKDVLEDDVDEKYYLSDERVAGLMASTLSTMQGGNQEPKIVASRGRNPNNPSDRTTGAPTVQRLEPRKDGLTNTITSVQKDNYVAEPTPLQRKVCNEAIARGLVEPNDAIEYTYSNARLKEIGGGSLKSKI